MAITVDEAVQAATRAELVPLGVLSSRFGEIHMLEGAPFGTRIVVDVADVRIDGERLTARMKGTAVADWATLAPDGTFQLDVRITLETHDGALVLVQYHGRCDMSAGLDAPGPVYGTPRFETGDPRYAWLNRVQAVQKGHLDLARKEIVYQMYELR
jgi:Protein of unknown function (DUF3237)